MERQHQATNKKELFSAGLVRVKAALSLRANVEWTLHSVSRETLRTAFPAIFVSQQTQKDKTVHGHHQTSEFAEKHEKQIQSVASQGCAL